MTGGVSVSHAQLPTLGDVNLMLSYHTNWRGGPVSGMRQRAPKFPGKMKILRIQVVQLAKCAAQVAGVAAVQRREQ